MSTLTLAAVGTSTGVVIPKEMLAHMNVAGEAAATQAVLDLAAGTLAGARYAAFLRGNVERG